MPFEPGLVAGRPQASPVVAHSHSAAQAADFLLRPLHLAYYGKDVSRAENNPSMNQEQISTISRIGYFFLAFTFWLPCTLIGLCIVSLCAKSHQDTSSTQIFLQSHGQGIPANPSTSQVPPRPPRSGPATLANPIRQQAAPIRHADPIRQQAAPIRHADPIIHLDNVTLSSGALPTSPEFTQHYEINTWPDAPKTREACLQALRESSAPWHTNHHEELMSRPAAAPDEPMPTQERERCLNAGIIHYVRQNHPDLITPFDLFPRLLEKPLVMFSDSFRARPAEEQRRQEERHAQFPTIQPPSIQAHPQVFEMEENVFYDFETLTKIQNPKGSACSFAIARKGNAVYLFSAEHPRHYTGIFVNERYYPATLKALTSTPLGPNAYAPIAQLKEGSMMYGQANIHLSINVGSGGKKYMFTVGPNGSLFIPQKNPPQSRSLPPGLDREIDQTVEYTRPSRGDFRPTTNPNAAWIDAPLQYGFRSIDTAQIRELAPDSLKWQQSFTDVNVERVFYMPGQDPLFDKLVAYLRVEFEEMRYGDEEKLLRLAQLTTLLLQNPSQGKRIPNENYSLGNFLDVGLGVCRHHSLLFKALSDQLGLHSALVSSTVHLPAYSDSPAFDQPIAMLIKDMAGHAWIISHIHGKPWLVDPTQGYCFPLAHIPGSTGEYREFLREFYGIPRRDFD